MDLGSIQIRTSDKYRHECIGILDVKRFDGVVVDGKNFVMFDQTHFERDTALGVWKRH